MGQVVKKMLLLKLLEQLGRVFARGYRQELWMDKRPRHKGKYWWNNVSNSVSQKLKLWKE